MLKIGITSRIVEASNYVEPRDALSQNWSDFLEKISALPIIIPNTFSKLDEFLNELRLDGIILSGGDNIGNHPKRDSTEKKLIDFAIQSKTPILGVCRGMQVINHYFGGKHETVSTKEHVGKEHPIEITSKNFSDLLNMKMINVNSFHNNIITNTLISENLTPFAISTTDNTIEGFFHNELPIIGVMWHPEREQKEFDIKIFQQLFSR